MICFELSQPKCICSVLHCALQQALFPGDSELQQLLHIFKFLGTPDEAIWPGVSKLRDWHEFPNWKAQEMARAFPSLEPAGIELMKGMFIYDPVKRMSVSLHSLAASKCRHSRQLSVLSHMQHSIWRICMPVLLHVP